MASCPATETPSKESFFVVLSAAPPPPRLQVMGAGALVSPPLPLLTQWEVRGLGRAGRPCHSHEVKSQLLGTENDEVMFNANAGVFPMLAATYF